MKDLLPPETKLTILKFCKRSDKIFEYDITLEKWQKAKLDKRYRYQAFQVGFHGYKNTIKL